MSFSLHGRTNNGKFARKHSGIVKPVLVRMPDLLAKQLLGEAKRRAISREDLIRSALAAFAQSFPQSG